MWTTRTLVSSCIADFERKPYKQSLILVPKAELFLLIARATSDVQAILPSKRTEKRKRCDHTQRACLTSFLSIQQNRMTFESFTSTTKENRRYLFPGGNAKVQSKSVACASMKLQKQEQSHHQI